MSRKHHSTPPRTNMEVIISIVIIMDTTLGTTIPLYIQSNNQIEAIRVDISAIHQEIKDFHGRLCTIEERNKGAR